MNDDQILERLAGIVRDVLNLNVVTLRPSTTAADVEGWDSLAHVQIMVAIEQTFGTRFRTGEIAGVSNIGELVQRIRVKLPAGADRGL